MVLQISKPFAGFVWFFFNVILSFLLFVALQWCFLSSCLACGVATVSDFLFGVQKGVPLKWLLWFSLDMFVARRAINL